MGSRGRPSAASLALATSNGEAVGVASRKPRRTKYQPPSDFSPAEKKLWRAIVGALSADWFDVGDLPILGAYCQACVLFDRVSLQCLTASFTVVTAQGSESVNPVFKLQDMTARRMSSLAVKLRLTQSAKWTEQKAATNHAKTKGTKKPWE